MIDDGRKDGFFKSLFSPASPRPEPRSLVPPEPTPGEYGPDRDLAEIQLVLPYGFLVKGSFSSEFFASLHNLAERIAFEIIGVKEGIIIQLCLFRDDVPELKASLNAFFPEIGVRDKTNFLDFVLPELDADKASCIDFGLCEFAYQQLMRGPHFDVDPLTGVIGSLNDLVDGELGMLQVLWRPNHAPWGRDLWNLIEMLPGYSDIRADVRKKFSEPNYSSIIRVMGFADDASRAFEIARRIGGAVIAATRSSDNMLIPLDNAGYSREDHFLDFLNRTTHRSGMLLSQSELLSLVHLPTASVRSGRLTRSLERTKKAPRFLQHGSVVVGENEHEDDVNTVTLSDEHRLKHTWLVGASGTGKSTLLLSMMLQDAEQGRGFALLDPHGDLFDDLLLRLPENRLKDVVIIDPADQDYPVGFNVLSAHSDLERTLLSSDLVGVFQRFSTSWGDQMSSVLANAVLAFLESTTGGSLLDLRRFLIDASFRAEFIKTVKDPEVVYYWQHEFPLLRGGSQAPLLTRLDSFIRPKLIRYMIAQRNDRLDFRTIMDQSKIVLARFSHGAIGEENAYLLGSLLVARINQAAMSRQQQEARYRVPFFLYLDEFHHFITPSLNSILSGARKYGLGLVLAHQSLSQLKGRGEEILGAVMGNAFTRFVFRVGEQDARALSDGFSFFETADLQSLAVGEAIVRVEQPQFDFNLATVRSAPVDSSPDRIARAYETSRARYAQSRTDVIDLLTENQGKTSSPPPDVAASPTAKAPKTPAPPPKVAPIETPQPVTRETISAPDGVVEREAQKQQGRGGSAHTYLQSLLKKAAEEHGLRASVEQSVLANHGHVDLSVESDSVRIACEISISTDVGHEVQNIQKCLAAGYDLVVLVSPDRKFLTRVELAAASFPNSDLEKLRFLAPESAIVFLGEIAATHKAREGSVRGYKVKTKYSAMTAEERKHRERILGEVISKSLRNLP